MEPKAQKRKPNPEFYRGAVEEMFSEELTVSQMPEDWWIDGKHNSAKYINFSNSLWMPEGECRIRRKIDRLDPEQLERVISANLEKFLDERRFHTKKNFKTLRLDTIKLYKKSLCPNWKKNPAQLELREALQAYKAALLRITKDELAQGQEMAGSINEGPQLPEIELKTQKEQIRLLHDLGVIEFLESRYHATLKGNRNQVAGLISKFLKLSHTSIQPTINALLANNAGDKNYPKVTERTTSIIDHLNANESI